MSIKSRVANFIDPQSDRIKELTSMYLRDNARGASDPSSLFSLRDNTARDLPQMVADPIIGSALAVVMETAFQPSSDNALFKITSDYSKVADELDAFHEEVNMDETVLTVAYNLMVHGNLPIRHFYDKNMRYERYEYVPSYRDVTPIVLANRTVGYQVNGEFHDSYEYSYGQHLYFKDLGGLGRRRGSKSPTDDKFEVTNGFTYAPSYLSGAVRPWRSIKVVEDALLLQRMDLSTYMRIISVNVGDQVFSKNAIRLLNFYREIFKKVRRVSFNGDGMSATSFGNEFEVIIPSTGKQNIDVKDIGGQVDIRALRDLEILYKKLFSSLRLAPSMIGFSEQVPSSLGESGAVQRWDERFARLVKAVRMSTTKLCKEIDTFYLRSRGYDISPKDFNYVYVAASTVEDEERRNALLSNVKALSEIISTLDSSKIKFNRDYLVKEYFSQALSATSVDTEKLFGDEHVPKKITSDRSLVRDRVIKDCEFLVSAKFLSEEEAAILKQASVPSLSGLQSITSAAKSKDVLSYEKYLALGDILSAGCEVDLSSRFRSHPVDRGRFRKQSKSAIIEPVADIVVDTAIHSADNLSSGTIAEIGDLYLVDGGYHLTGQDLYNYLYMLDQGVKGIPVKRVWKEDKDA